MFTQEDLILVQNILRDQKSYYNIYFKLKPNGNKRMIVAPNEEYKLLQKKINYWFRKYAKFDIHSSAYAWEPNKSREDCARLHVNQVHQCEVDIKDYFTNITPWHLQGILSYNENIPVLLNMLCIDLDRFINLLTITDRDKRFLPQGFVTSPILANAVRYRIDVILSEWAKINNYIYSTFGDNIYISGQFYALNPLEQITSILNQYKFQVNKRKSKIKRQSDRQDIVGLVVNKKLSIPKEYIHNLIQNVLDKSEDLSVILGKLNVLNSSENKRNYNFVKRIIGYKYGHEWSQV